MNNTKIEEIEEIKRLQTVLSYNILDTPYEKDFDELAQLIALICDVPIAIISMIDDKRQWFKAKVGIPSDETPIEETFCQYTVVQDELLEISDALLDERVKNNPHVTIENGIRFYAGMPLKTGNGYNIGTVCVVGDKPKELNERQREALKLLTKQAMHLMESRKMNQNLGTELNAILEKKIAETQKKLELKETENRYLMKAIRNSSGVVEFTPDGNIISVNNNFEEISGYKEEELLDRQYEILIPSEDLTENSKLWATLNKGEFRTGRLRRIHKNGSEIYLRATYNPIHNLDNKLVKIVMISQDITREIEAELSLQNAKELAEDLNKQKDNFIANVSHEIRTPIHAVLGFTDLLLEKENDSQKINYLKSVKTAGDSLLYIVNDILDLSKMEAGMLQIENEVFDVREVVAKVFAILHLKAHQKEIGLIPHIDQKVPKLFIGDKNRLSQVLINLVGNAIKFTSKGSVKLRVNATGGNGELKLKFKVSDTGIGIPDEKLENIFKRFSQAEENTSRKYGGTGLGLNISKQLIEKQAGEIKVNSVVGKGTNFIFSIPYKVANSGEIPNLDVATKIQKNYTRARILVCEDNELNQRLVNAILTEKGHQVDIVPDGRKALKFLLENTYDLIFMDLQMPVKNGYETTEAIRNELKLTLPIIAITANFMVSERQKCLNAGMNDYLTKPFEKQEFLAKVEEWASSNSVDNSLENKEVQQKSEVVKPEVSFTMLNELSGGNKEFEKELILIFIVQSKKILEEMETDLQIENYSNIADNAHKLKSSFGIVGANTDILTKLENVKNKPVEKENTPAHIEALKRQVQEIFNILQKYN